MQRKLNLVPLGGDEVKPDGHPGLDAALVRGTLSAAAPESSPSGFSGGRHACTAGRASLVPLLDFGGARATAMGRDAWSLDRLVYLAVGLLPQSAQRD